MKPLKVVLAIVPLLTILPIWLFLLHRILTAVNAGELMWFLYWVYVPVVLLVTFINKLITDNA